MDTTTTYFIFYAYVYVKDEVAMADRMFFEAKDDEEAIIKLASIAKRRGHPEPAIIKAEKLIVTNETEVSGSTVKTTRTETLEAAFPDLPRYYQDVLEAVEKRGSIFDQALAHEAISKAR